MLPVALIVGLKRDTISSEYVEMGQIDSTGRVLGAAPKIWSQIPYVSEKLFFILLTRVISCNQIQSLYGSVQKGVMTCDNAFAKSEGA